MDPRPTPSHTGRRGKASTERGSDLLRYTPRGPVYVLALCAAFLEAAKRHAARHGSRSLEDVTVLTRQFDVAFRATEPAPISGSGAVDFGAPGRRDMCGPSVAVALARRIVELSRQIESRAMLDRLARLAAGEDPEQVLGTDAPALLAADAARLRTPSDDQVPRPESAAPEPAPAGSGALAPSVHAPDMRVPDRHVPDRHVPGVQAAAGDIPRAPEAPAAPEIALAAVDDDDAAIDCAPVAQLSEAARREALERAFLPTPRHPQVITTGAPLPLPAMTAGGEGLPGGRHGIAVASGSGYPGIPADSDPDAAAPAAPMAVGPAHGDWPTATGTPEHRSYVFPPSPRPRTAHIAPDNPGNDDPDGDYQAPLRSPSSRDPEPRETPLHAATLPPASLDVPLQDPRQGLEGFGLPTWAVAAFPGDAPTTAEPPVCQPPPVPAGDWPTATGTPEHRSYVFPPSPRPRTAHIAPDNPGSDDRDGDYQAPLRSPSSRDPEPRETPPPLVPAAEYRDVFGPAPPAPWPPPRPAMAAGTAPSSGVGRGGLLRRYGGRWTWAAAAATSIAAAVALFVVSPNPAPDLPGAAAPTSGNPTANIVPPLLPPTALATASTPIPEPIAPQPTTPAPASSPPAPLRSATMQLEVAELRAAGAELRGLLEDAERRAEEAMERASAQERSAEDLARETAAMRRDAERSNTRLVEARAQAEALKADLATARARIEGLEREVRSAAAAARRNTVAGTAAGSTGSVAASASAPVQASRAAARAPQGVVPAGERGSSPVLTEAAARDAWTGAQPCLAVYLHEGETPLRLARRIGLHELVLFVLNRNFLTLQPYNPATGLGDRELLGIDQPLRLSGGTWLYVPPTIPSLESYQIRTLSAEELSGIRRVGFACSAEQITARLAEAEQAGSIARGTLRRPQ